MSLATFKKKTINSKSSATKRSGKPPGGIWLTQGPFGPATSLTSVMFSEGLKRAGPVGFSINGPHRSISVGADMKMSKSGTSFRGIYPMGAGGHGGRYYEAEPLFNAGYGKISVMGNQWEFPKQSVLSTKGMIEKKYKWINNGQYPNNWVQPLYTGNQTDTASQGVYVQSKAAANDCWYDVNDPGLYVNYFKTGGSTGCQTTSARGYTMGIQQSNAPYTKTLHIPKSSSDYTLRIQQRCQNPTGAQKPFPYAVTTGHSQNAAGTSITSFATGCNTTPIYNSPPAWYVATPKSQENNPYKPTPEQAIRNQIQVFQALILEGTS